jgi:TPR repeat protein
MTNKVKVLFFAADPLSYPLNGGGPRLQLDGNIERIGKRVRAAEHRNALEFVYRLAVSSEDLLQALNEMQPEVVHFSGHGTRDGLVLVGSGGEPHLVPTDALTQLFEIFRGDIRLVVLNACFSLPLAETIAEIVGCAIGMRREISDQAAITFDSSFYSAIAFGHSVQVAFDQACTALAMNHPGEDDCPALVAAPGVDPATLILVSPSKLAWLRTTVLGLAVVLAAVVALMLAGMPPLDWRPQCGWSRGGGLWTLTAAPLRASTMTVGAARFQSNLDAAKSLVAGGSHATALPLLRQAADAGNPEAMGFLGIALLHGEGTRSQPDSGIYWLRAAAKKHDPRAMTALGAAYQGGDGVDWNLYLAEHWYREAVKRGWLDAMHALAGLYRVEHHYDDALDLDRKAVRAGSVDAWVDAGRMYEEGLGVEQYPKEAVCLYRTAAKAGSASGMYELGRSYEEAVGVRQDFGEARNWYLKASNRGSAEAMNAMGRLYQNGWGVPRDSATAIYWYGRARDAGSKVAAGNLQALGAE